VFARDQRNGRAGSQRLFDYGALETDWMMALAAALRTPRRGLNDCVHNQIFGHKLFVPPVSIMDKSGFLEQTVLAHRLRMEAIIPSRRNRKLPRPLDSTRYFARHLVENLFQRMKIFRRVATRFEKLDERFLGFIYIAGIMKWIH
jgi:hypothetical protein